MEVIPEGDFNVFNNISSGIEIYFALLQIGHSTNMTFELFSVRFSAV